MGHGLAHLAVRIPWACLLASALAAGPQETKDSGSPTVTFRKQTTAGQPSGYSKRYAFSDDFFSDRIPLWKQVFGPMAGKPNLHYLEIGVYEGRSFLWMLENVLTHPTCRLTGMDIFIPSEIEQRFLDNVRLSGQAHRVTSIKGPSRVKLRKLALESMDVIYVDGSHTADDVLADAVLAWGLLKNGGMIVFDDVQWDGSYYTGRGSHLPAELTPGLAVNAFVQVYRNNLELVYSGYQVILKKRANPCPNTSACSPLGDYTYEWKEKKLFRGSSRQPVPLTPAEVRALETIFWNRQYQGRFVVPRPVLDTPEARALVGRLNLKAELAAAQ